MRGFRFPQQCTWRCSSGWLVHVASRQLTGLILYRTVTQWRGTTPQTNRETSMLIRRVWLQKCVLLMRLWTPSHGEFLGVFVIHINHLVKKINGWNRQTEKHAADFPCPKLNSFTFFYNFKKKKNCTLLVNRFNDITLKSKTGVSTSQIRMALCRRHDFRDFIKINETVK